VSLTPTEFPAFFEALWGYSAFPWQERLAELVATNGWPKALDLPTASGKTAAIDIALFHLALEADQGCSRKAPVRIAFVVDRRLVVDGAYDRARGIARKLARAEDGILRNVADRLRGLCGETEPLRAVRLRGGTPMEPDWVRSPAQPTIVVSTVDQVGSRLLFRGYGVSDSMRPVHAGLLGSDALFLLDEAHLSQPFVETLGWVERYRSAPWAEAEAGPFAVVHLSATLPWGEKKPFGLTDADRVQERLRPRLEAHKPAELRTAKSGLNDVKGLAAEFAAAARDLAAKDETAAVIAIVINRVALARAVRDALHQALRGDDGEASADVTLLIGRSRPLDRDRLLKDVLPRMAAGRSTDQQGRPLYVVATQCIEAGADLDFDALVTQIAPLDCLRQRFGRLDRLGERHKKGHESHARILAAAGEIAKKAVDPIYGDAVAKTWAWLLERGGGDKTVDFGIDHLKLPGPADLGAPLAPRAHAPVVLPAYVDAWTQTSPPPGADPQVSLFLHGPDAGPADVQIVWRADLEEANLRDGDRAREIVASCAPSSLEALAVPIAAARRWLANAEPPEIADVEGASVGVAEDRRERDRDHRRALRWRGPDDAATGLIEPHQVRPGDLIVVPAAYGGCDASGWNPSLRREVFDLGLEANLRHRRRLILRLDQAVVRNTLRDDLETADRLWRRISDCLEEWHDDLLTLVSELAELDDLPEIWARALKELGPKGFTLGLRDVDSPGRGGTLSLRRQLDASEVQIIFDEPLLEAEGAEPATEDDATSVTGAAVGLADHCSEVAEFARAFALKAALSPERVNDITLAARLHDLGKAEARFQLYLRGGDEFAFEIDPRPLAKSGTRPTRQELRRAARLAALPSGARHECWSVELARSMPRMNEASDPELVLWLIGTHHGQGRPFFPPVMYPVSDEELAVEFSGARLAASVEVPVWRLDSGWIERFERLKRRYGPWELARMEAILRLADHRASESAGSP
jgi:CRISPR-associated endonuclease/helicase Cas3